MDPFSIDGFSIVAKITWLWLYTAGCACMSIVRTRREMTDTPIGNSCNRFSEPFVIGKFYFLILLPFYYTVFLSEGTAWMEIRE